MVRVESNVASSEYRLAQVSRSPRFHAWTDFSTSATVSSCPTPSPMHEVSRSRDNPVVPSNLDLVRAIYADWERGDFGRSDWISPEIEYVRVGDGPGSGTWCGKAEMAEAVREWLSPWGDVRSIGEDYREVDKDRVLVLGHEAMRGKRSELAGEFPSAALFEMRDGKVTRLTQYTTHERALADAGLGPETDPR